MQRSTPKRNSPQQSLRKLLEIYSKVHVRFGVDTEHSYTTLGFTTNDFSALGQYSPQAEVLDVIVHDDEARMLITEYPNAPALATLLRESDGTWKVDSFSFECPVCFGRGLEEDDRLCRSCGATGWGALSFNSYRSDP